MRSTFQLALATALTLGTLMHAQAAGIHKDADAIYKPTGKGYGVIDEEATAKAKGGASPAKAATTNGINYHNGPLMVGNTNVYYIWYGTWTANQKTILTNFMQSLGGTPLFNVNTSYYDSAKNHVKNVVVLAGQSSDNYSLGKSLSDANIQTIVANQISGGHLPKDTNGVYFVLTAPDVNETSGFGSQYCGWHNNGTISGSDIKYAFVGNPATIAPSGCGVNSPSPNGDGGVDAMASVMFHELSETVTDPDGTGWYDKSGNENGDKCAWNFGSTFTTSNGATANVTFGGRNWKLQQMWLNANGGVCALKY